MSGKKWTPTAGTNQLVALRLAPETIERIDAMAAELNTHVLPGMPRIDRAAVIRVAILDLLSRRTDGAIKAKPMETRTHIASLPFELRRSKGKRADAGKPRPNSGNASRRSPKGDTSAADKLLRESFSDAAVSAATNVPRSTVRRMRARLGIAPLTLGGKVRE